MAKGLQRRLGGVLFAGTFRDLNAPRSCHRGQTWKVVAPSDLVLWLHHARGNASLSGWLSAKEVPGRPASESAQRKPIRFLSTLRGRFILQALQAGSGYLALPRLRGTTEKRPQCSQLHRRCFNARGG